MRWSFHSTWADTTSDTANAVALQPDGKIVVAGAAQLGTDDRDFAVARLNRDGSLDEKLSQGSVRPLCILIWAQTRADEATGVAVQPDGKIVLAGYSQRRVRHRVDYRRCPPWDRWVSGRHLRVWPAKPPSNLISGT